MTILLIIVHVFVCLVLIAVILLQAGRGQGLSWGTFGGSPQSILGTRTASFFTKLTTVCAVLFLFTCIGLNIIETHKSKSLMNLSNRAVSDVDLDKLKEVLNQVKQADEETSGAVAAGEAVIESEAPTGREENAETPPSAPAALQTDAAASDVT